VELGGKTDLFINARIKSLFIAEDGIIQVATLPLSIAFIGTLCCMAGIYASMHLAKKVEHAALENVEKRREL